MENTEHTEHTEKTGDAGSDHSHRLLLHASLSEAIRQTAFEVHRYFGAGFLERVYARALENRLKRKGFNAHSERFTIRDEDGTILGVYEADLVVEGTVLVEIKAVSHLCIEHQAQTLNYMKASRLRVGLLINFGSPVIQIKRFVR